MVDELTLVFEHERDTKNMRRYRETGSSPDILFHEGSSHSIPLVGTLYLLKAAADALGNPAVLHVKIHTHTQSHTPPNRAARRAKK